MSDFGSEEISRAFKDSFRKVFRNGKTSKLRIRIGRHAALIHFSNPTLDNIMGRSLAHIWDTGDESPSLHLYCLDGDAAPRPYLINPEDTGVHGLIEKHSSERFHTAYQHGSGAIMMYDRQSKEGVYWIARASSIPYWEASFPFRTLFHWWSADTPYQLLHAGAIGTASSAAIVTGKSGAGKSGTCLSAILHKELFVAGDDYVLADTAELTVHSLYNCAKVEWGGLDRMPYVKPLIANGEKGDAKAMIYLNESIPEQVLLGGILKFCFIPVITGGSKTTLVEDRTAEALRSLAPTTLFQLPLYQREAFEKCSILVRNLRTVRVNLGTDPVEISDTVADFFRRN